MSTKNKKVVVCDYPCKYTFPSFGFGSAEKRIWQIALTISEMSGYEVILTGDAWLPQCVPKAKHFPQRLDSSTIDEFLSLHGRSDYLFGGNEYFDKDEKYVQPFLQAADKLFSYQSHVYDYNNKIVFDGKIKFLFCYSDEMIERYKKQNPFKSLLFHSGVNEIPYLTKKPKDYLLWMGRIDKDKAPHYAILAAKKLNQKIKILGEPKYQPDYIQTIQNLLNDNLVEIMGTVHGDEKMQLISEAKCAIYTLDKDYIEAGAGVLGEYLISGVPIAAISWRGNDAICEAVDQPQLGQVQNVNPSMSEEEIVNKLSESVIACKKLDRRIIYQIGQDKYNMVKIMKRIFTMMDRAS